MLAGAVTAAGRGVRAGRAGGACGPGVRAERKAVVRAGRKAVVRAVRRAKSRASRASADQVSGQSGGAANHSRIGVPLLASNG